MAVHWFLYFAKTRDCSVIPHTTWSRARARLGAGSLPLPCLEFLLLRFLSADFFTLSIPQFLRRARAPFYQPIPNPRSQGAAKRRSLSSSPPAASISLIT